MQIPGPHTPDIPGAPEPSNLHLQQPPQGILMLFFFLKQILLLHIYKICIVVVSVFPSHDSLINLKIWIPNLEPFKNYQEGIFLSLHIHIYIDFFFLFTNPHPLFFRSKKGEGHQNVLLGQQQP